METTAKGKQKRFTRKEWSWIMYDWANSIYATNIMAAIFPTIFVSIAGDAGDTGGATAPPSPPSWSPCWPRCWAQWPIIRA